jgi:hypothetical protein
MHEWWRRETCGIEQHVCLVNVLHSLNQNGGEGFRLVETVAFAKYKNESDRLFRYSLI